MTRRRSSTHLMPSLFMAGLEAQQVIALRMMKLALGGPAADKEAVRMVGEKMETAVHVQSRAAAAILAGGAAGVPAATLATYRRRMRANRRRLMKGG